VAGYEEAAVRTERGGAPVPPGVYYLLDGITWNVE
jgi:hypothetical protein